MVQNAIPNVLLVFIEMPTYLNLIQIRIDVHHFSMKFDDFEVLIRCLEESLSLQELRSDEALDLGSFALLALLHFTTHHELAHVILPWHTWHTWWPHQGGPRCVICGVCSCAVMWSIRFSVV